MSGVFTYSAGNSELLISIPHDGREIPDEMAAAMTAEGRAIPDTDWHVRRLYDAVEAQGASVIAADFSRYVVDLNRPPADEALYEGQVSTGLCPRQTFAGEPIYRDGLGIDAAETERRMERYWRPYHTQIAVSLEEIRKRHGYALLWDAHSIRSRVPRLFEGDLPELNIGTDDGRSCPAAVHDRISAAANDSGFTVADNARFTGGYITRHYGAPRKGVFAVQLELAQRAYMDESMLRYDEARAGKLAATIAALLDVFRGAAAAARVRGA